MDKISCFWTRWLLSGRVHQSRALNHAVRFCWLWGLNESCLLLSWGRGPGILKEMFMKQHVRYYSAQHILYPQCRCGWIVLAARDTTQRRACILCIVDAKCCCKYWLPDELLLQTEKEKEEKQLFYVCIANRTDGLNLQHAGGSGYCSPLQKGICLVISIFQYFLYISFCQWSICLCK